VAIVAPDDVELEYVVGPGSATTGAVVKQPTQCASNATWAHWPKHETAQVMFPVERWLHG
jgi:hypothetical protein